jgi:hypothetical protein
VVNATRPQVDSEARLQAIAGKPDVELLGRIAQLQERAQHAPASIGRPIRPDCEHRIAHHIRDNPASFGDASE